MDVIIWYFLAILDPAITIMPKLQLRFRQCRRQAHMYAIYVCRMQYIHMYAIYMNICTVYIMYVIYTLYYIYHIISYICHCDFGTHLYTHESYMTVWWSHTSYMTTSWSHISYVIIMLYISYNLEMHLSRLAILPWGPLYNRGTNNTN